MSNRTIIFALSLLVGLCGLTLRAQQEPLPTRKVNVKTLLLSEHAEPVFVREAKGGGWVRCNLSKRRVSPPVEITAVGDQIIFYQPGVGTDETGAPLYNPVGSAVLPAGGKNFLLLFSESKDATEGAKYRLAAIPRDGLVGKRGQTILYNMSSYPIVGESGGERFSLKRGGYAEIHPEANKNNNLSLRLARYANDDWQVAFSTVWGNNPDLNTLFFIFDARGGKDKIEVKRFYDSPIPTPPPPEVSGL
ncbi:hypothetical protein H5P28_18025 [Ruficoccus amylovorans]|uniref:Uncharacterized protein n=1 Tax=Ruficoccus amylovorans TaxID=1804625 RepID=A0A842HJ57_9BACT|nr:hypothetical protein [Ruficoccus amylovorans]MBC2596170.1 hypothetical protein [Ruficoccus amylovorans]